MEVINSHELESLVLEVGPGLSVMQYSTWGQFFDVLYGLQASNKRLSVILDSFERFMARKYKGETLTRFLGCRNSRR